jgi:hypothetical protein
MVGWQVNDDDKQMRTNIHALSRIRTLVLRVQAIKTYASDSAATGASKAEVGSSCSTLDIDEKWIKILVGKPNEKRQL